MNATDLPMIALGALLAVWDWLASKYVDLGEWATQPLTGGWAFSGLIYIWVMHWTTRDKITRLSKQVDGLQQQLIWMAERLNGDR